MKKSSSILSKLLTSYLIIVAIPLIGFIAMYSWMASNVENYALRVNEEIIANAYEKINEIVGKVDSSQLSFANNARVNAVSQFREVGMEEDFECYLLQKEIKGILSSNEYIYHMYIYFPKSDICVFETTTMEADAFFERYYGMTKEESTEWKSFLLQTKYTEQEKKLVIEGSGNADCIEFLQKYPVTEKRVSAICVVSVRMDKLFASLIRGDANSEFMVVNRGDNILFQNDNSSWSMERVMETLQRDNGKQKGVLISEHILKSGWQLYSLTDREKVLTKLNEIRSVSLVLLAIYAAICWYLIRTLTKRNYEPLQKLLRSISDSRNIEYEKNTNEYEWIQVVWASTREDVKKQRAVVVEKFLQMLLKGRVSEEEWKEKCEKYGIYPVGEDYVVLCFKITDPENLFADDEEDADERGKLELAYFIINNIATEIFMRKYFVLSVNMDDAVILILNYADNGENNVSVDINGYVAEIKNTVKQYFNFEFLTVISDEHSFYYGVHESYKQVLEGLEHQLFYQKNAVIEYSRIKKSLKTDYYYPLEMEQNLISCITSGNVTEAQRMVDELFKQNFEQIAGNKSLAKCFMSDFMATMIKAVSKVVPNLVMEENSETSKLMSKLLDSDNIHEMKKYISLLLEHVCSNISSKSGSDTTDKVVAFVEENYADSQLSTTSIAEVLNLHPVYLGSLFKERTGEKLLDYIAGYRIEKAKNLLKEQPAVAMEDVGKMVGYDNVRTFSRVFKKYEGITPAQYKKGL